MIMKKQRITSAIAFIFLFTVVGYSQSAEPSQDPGQQLPTFRQLGLSSEQLQKIKEINQRQRPKIQQSNLAVDRARAALDDAIYADEISEERVKEALGRFSRAQVELANVRMQTEFEIRKVLTPDQLKQFRQMRSARQTQSPSSPPRGRRGSPPKRERRF
jgi:Spy/CpxP family protein refolding chaperone